MKNCFIVFIFVFCAIGCQDVKLPERPKNLIEKNKMIEILSEAYIVNAARSVDYKSVLNKGVKLDSLIYQKYDVDSLQFAESNAFYSADINTYIDMFQKIQIKLEKLNVEMDSLRTEKMKLDSINNFPPAENPVPVLRDSLI